MQERIKELHVALYLDSISYHEVYTMEHETSYIRVTSIHSTLFQVYLPSIIYVMFILGPKMGRLEALKEFTRWRKLRQVR